MSGTFLASAPVSPASSPPLRQVIVGALLALVTVSIWSIWIVGTRQAVSEHLPLAWLGLIRYGVPAVLLAPFWWRVGLLPRGVHRRLIALMVAGAGFPFFLAVATGMRFVPSAAIGVLLSGPMPLCVAILSAVVDRERFGASRIAGFALVVAATVAIGGPALLGGAGAGFLFIPAGALLWAFFTIAYRRSGLDPLAAAGIVAAWSALAFLPFALTEGAAAILAADPRVLVTQLLSQGLLSGVVALVSYGGAISRLGASRAAVVTSLAPALAALMAVPWLGEVPTPAMLGGILLALVGVALGSGAVGFKRG